MTEEQFQKLLVSAHGGDANAQLQVGEYLLEKQDYDTALPWFKMSSDAGNTQAGARANTLGYDYQIGQNGKRQNEQLAFKLYETSAECGNTMGMNNYAWCLCNGVGTNCNKEKAYQWWKISADSGDAWAMAQLAWCYENSSGTDQDMTLAATYYFKSYFYGKYKQYLDKFESMNVEPNPEILQKDEIIWLANYYAAAGGFGGTEPDNADADFRWNKVATIYEDTDAMINVSNCYTNGWGTEMDKIKAFEYLKMADEKGNWRATQSLMNQYSSFSRIPEHLLITDKNDEMALQYAYKIINSVDNKLDKYEDAYETAYNICIKIEDYQQAGFLLKKIDEKGYTLYFRFEDWLKIARFYEEQQNKEEALFFYQQILKNKNINKDSNKNIRAQAEEKVRILMG